MRIGECLQFGWDTFKRYTGAFLFNGLALFVAGALAEAAAGVAARRLGPLLVMLVSGLFWGGWISVARKAARGEEPTLSDAFAPFTDRPGDYVIVGLAISAGVLLCGVGALVTYFLFLFAPLCVAEGANWQQALSRSKDLMLANVGESAVFLLVLAAVNVAGMIALGIGLFVSMPVTTVAIVKAYELASKPATLPPTGSEPTSV